VEGEVIRLRVDRSVPAELVDRVKLVADLYPGEHRLEILLERPPRIGPDGRLPEEDTTTLVLGDMWMAEASVECIARLEKYGMVEVVEE
jgi:hypothetical protein